MELVAVYIFGRNLRRERRYRDPLDPLHVSDEHLLRYYRFPRHEIINLCQDLEQHIGRRTRRAHAIPTHTQLLVTLRFLASGTFQSVIGDTVGLTQASVSRVISQTTHVLYEKARAEVKMPTSIVDINRTVQKVDFQGLLVPSMEHISPLRRQTMNIFMSTERANIPSMFKLCVTVTS